MIGNALYTVRSLFFAEYKDKKNMGLHTFFKTVPYRLSSPLYRDCLFRNGICRNSVTTTVVSS